MTSTMQHRSCVSSRTLRAASAEPALAIMLLAAVVATPSAQAQTRFAAPARAARTTTAVPFRSAAGTRLPMRSGGRFFPRSGFLPYPYWYPPYFFLDSDSEPVTTGALPPEVVVVQTAPPSAQTLPPSPREPLLLELQGDEWVRVTSYGQSPVGTQSARPESSPASSPSSVTPRRSLAEPVRELPPAVLVFRDGHQEEVKNYTIIGPTLYTRADYWSSGSWTRQVQIAQLNIPATLKTNQERGAKFSLPSGPNEIVVRP